MTKKILLVVGARPNFINASAVHRALLHYPRFVLQLEYSGHHYDEQRSDIIFDPLG